MARCFCGCGHTVRFRIRAVNKRGSIIDGDVASVRTLLARDLSSPNAEVLVHDGDLLLAELADAVHTGIDPGPRLQ
ncbi:MAG TPA: hypothetical protein VNS09_26310 [Solirubrobacter sp.]|nr:hypothetical protein [Solirubrobacter sp.]